MGRPLNLQLALRRVQDTRESLVCINNVGLNCRSASERHIGSLESTLSIFFSQLRVFLGLGFKKRGFERTQITEERSDVIVAKELCFLYTASALTLAHPAVCFSNREEWKEV